MCPTSSPVRTQRNPGSAGWGEPVLPQGSGMWVLFRGCSAASSGGLNGFPAKLGGCKAACRVAPTVSGWCQGLNPGFLHEKHVLSHFYLFTCFGQCSRLTPGPSQGCRTHGILGAHFTRYTPSPLSDPAPVSLVLVSPGVWSHDSVCDSCPDLSRAKLPWDRGWGVALPGSG